MTAATDLAEAIDDIADIWLSPRLSERVIAQLEDKGWTIGRKLAPLPSTTELHQSMLDEVNRERAERRKQLLLSHYLLSDDGRSR